MEDQPQSLIHKVYDAALHIVVVPVVLAGLTIVTVGLSWYFRQL